LQEADQQALVVHQAFKDGIVPGFQEFVGHGIPFRAAKNGRGIVRQARSKGNMGGLAGGGRKAWAKRTETTKGFKGRRGQRYFKKKNQMTLTFYCSV
jgi:hypothetical protein